jgi:transcriptional regulator with XRE-family HTH domain
MDDVRVGRLLRALRRRRGLRQADVGRSAGVAQSTISLIERGHLDRLAISTVRAIFATVDARFEGTVSWRGGAIDRLLDERHSLVVGEVARLLRSLGWLVEVEVSFAVYGERGSIDVLAYHPGTRALLIVEVKTELTSIEETIRRHDVKVRHAPAIAKERFGWNVELGGRLLIVLDSSTSRRRVARHDASLRVAYPARGREIRQWLRRPARRLGGLMFLSFSNRSNTRSTGRAA